ncbi:MAG: hypothetical protein WC394_03540 [Candidatus Omnitrophota bacterium]|jgi:hypothetical protein
MSVLYKSGCLLPFLIIFNLFFGRLFFSFRTWLAVGGVLTIFFLVNSCIFSRRIINNVRRRDNVIDVEGEVISDREKLK